jgi:hypothetical protein
VLLKKPFLNLIMETPPVLCTFGWRVAELSLARCEAVGLRLIPHNEDWSWGEGGVRNSPVGCKYRANMSKFLHNDVHGQWSIPALHHDL